MTESLPYILLVLFAVPSAITGLAVWQLKRAIEKSEKRRETADKARDDYNVIVIESVNASIALGEATAKAVQKIPDAHCNGDMHAALAYTQQVKHRQKDFLTRKGVEKINS